MMRRGWLFFVLLSIVGPAIVTAAFALGILVFGLAELASEQRMEAGPPPAVLMLPPAPKPPRTVAKAGFR